MRNVLRGAGLVVALAVFALPAAAATRNDDKTTDSGPGLFKRAERPESVAPDAVGDAIAQWREQVRQRASADGAQRPAALSKQPWWARNPLGAGGNGDGDSSEGASDERGKPPKPPKDDDDDQGEDEDDDVSPSNPF